MGLSLQHKTSNNPPAAREAIETKGRKKVLKGASTTLRWERSSLQVGRTASGKPGAQGGLGVFWSKQSARGLKSIRSVDASAKAISTKEKDFG